MSDTFPTLAAALPPAALFTGLLDDAALFPPGNAPMQAGIDAYLRSLHGEDAPYIGAFLCPWSRTGELRAALPSDVMIDLSLTISDGIEALDDALAAVAADDRLTLRAVELPAGSAGVPPTLDALDAGLPAGVLAYVELPLDDHVAANAAVIAAAGRGVKVRTGGTTAAAFPTCRELALGLLGCAHADVPFKLTAGLHNAFRHHDTSNGFEHHGFLNVMAAVASATDGADLPEVASLLDVLDFSMLRQWAATVPAAEATRVRTAFIGFGTCSTAEPLADLRTLGLLPEVKS